MLIIWIRAAVENTLSLLTKEDPQRYFAEPVDPSLVPGYREVVSEEPGGVCRKGQTES